jgi:DNA (cytosine-5)-methyltransferase 1
MPKKNSYITATDQFCGAGGSTTGAKLAGVEVKMALNHWKLAIETHNTNHPDTDHDCTDVQACDPRRYPSTDILITSPECTNHSLAKGRKRKFQEQYKLFGKVDIRPEEERSRATMWDVPRFAEFHDYNIIIVENVVDARYWRLWQAWLKAMHDLGYDHQCCYLNSMFFQPCPQSRDRMYVVFWKKGNKKPNLEFRPVAPCHECGEKEAYQHWKKAEKKWGKYKQQYVYRCSNCYQEVTPYYYAAFNCIDWTLPGTRIGDRKRPLAKKTIERIKYGLEKYGKEPFYLATRYTSGVSSRVKKLSGPIGTQSGGVSHGFCVPFVLNSAYNKKPRLVTDNLQAVTTHQSMGICTPFIINSEFKTARIPTRVRSVNSPYFTQTTTQSTGILVPFLMGNYSPGWCRPVTKPTGTITSIDSHTLFQMPLIVENYGTSKSKKATDPIGAITTNTNHGILSDENLNAFLTYYYSGSQQASRATDPINTITTGDRAAIVKGQVKLEDCYYRMLKPHEIQRAMAFHDEYIVLGNSKQKVKQLGNAVTPPVMEWLVHRCVESLK